MAYVNLLDNPLYGDHAPLVLGWSDDQLHLIADRLRPSLLPANRTDQMWLAIAAVARSLVTERTVTRDLGVHYARAKNPYSQRKRYRTGDPRFTWYYVTRAMDYLRQARLIGHVVGEWSPYCRGFESVAWASEELVELIGALIDPSEPREVARKVETIVLRDGNGREVDYEETKDTIAMRDQVRAVNLALSRLDLRRGGQRMSVPIGRRIFNESFGRGGRLYCHGASFQNLRASERSGLEVVIDGQIHATVEIDYSYLHTTMAYAEAGEWMPPGDQYAIDGYDRGLVKLTVNTMLNAPTRQKALGAVTKALRERSVLRGISAVEPGDHAACRALAERVMAAIEEKHHRIKDYFGSDCGARFQRQDSDMAVKIMVGMIQRTGRCPLPIHDSFIVAKVDAEALRQTMVEVAGEYGLRVHLKDSSGDRTSTSPWACSPVPSSCWVSDPMSRCVPDPFSSPGWSCSPLLSVPPLRGSRGDQTSSPHSLLSHFTTSTLLGSRNNQTSSPPTPPRKEVTTDDLRKLSPSLGRKRILPGISSPMRQRSFTASRAVRPTGRPKARSPPGFSTLLTWEIIAPLQKKDGGTRACAPGVIGE
jgi:hypothetical protein